MRGEFFQHKNDVHQMKLGEKYRIKPNLTRLLVLYCGCLWKTLLCDFVDTTRGFFELKRSPENEQKKNLTGAIK